jgi:membrane associated rhomboid family serine protease
MFFFPLRDDNDTLSRPVITWIIFGICIAAFMWQIGLGPAERDMILAYGMIPARIFGYVSMPEELLLLPGWMTLISSMFMHGGFMHLAGNMLYLWIFADNVEDSTGPWRFILLYSISGFVAAFSHALMEPSSTTPMIGASGAIAGVLGAYLMLHPRANVKCIVGIFIFFRFINVPAFLVLSGWFALQFIGLSANDGPVAYMAHIGGFIAGVALVPFLKRRDVKLFDTPHSRPFEISQEYRPRHIPQIPPR